MTSEITSNRVAEKKTVGLWYGKPVEQLTKKELLKVIEWAGEQIVSLRKEAEELDRI